MSNSEYVRLSLELHLFYDRIMKEHSFFLEAGFTEKDKNLKMVARNFQNSFSDILKQIVELADGNVTNSLLSSNEIVTNRTLEAERKSSLLSGIMIDTNITEKELSLKSGRINSTNDMVNKIQAINKKTLPLIENLIDFKNDVLNNVLSCRMYTTNYPSLLSHIRNEAVLYHSLLNKLESRVLISKDDIYKQELFWDDIMKEHAEFIRGSLDPSEDPLILTADKFADDYKRIIANYGNNPNLLNSISLNETINFRNFKVTGLDGILDCKIKSIIIPLLADHVVREANHFIRLLQSSNS
ncbi:MAG: DUF2935 domain-containing protein [Firmicutes bacterium]|nr:DUF2935 domain-containing protein [Bacillota bacterium]